MEQLSEKLADSLMKKRFGSEEIPELINDLKLLLQQPENRTTEHVNQELESLGWGLQLLDESLFQMIVFHLVGSDGFIRSMEHKESK